jgi:prepilin-type N-terminal cleavage/methylation domain-containing protein
VRGRGVTLLELVVVLTIVGTAMALTLPSFGRTLRRWRADGAVREVATLLRFARNQAVTRQMPLQVLVDRERRVYWVDAADLPTLADPEQAAERGIRLSALPDGVGFGEARVGGLVQEADRVGIPFFPKGNSVGAELEILSGTRPAYRIVVEPVTGQARVLRPSGDGA